MPRCFALGLAALIFQFTHAFLPALHTGGALTPWPGQCRAPPRRVRATMSATEIAEHYAAQTFGEAAAASSLLPPLGALPPLELAADASAAAAALDADGAAGALASSLSVAFADQGGNAAGLFFQASLPPYLLYLYFLSCVTVSPLLPLVRRSLRRSHVGERGRERNCFMSC